MVIARIAYIYGPIETKVKLMIGKIACLDKSRKREISPTGGGALYMPPVGKIFSTTPKTTIASILIHQAGIAFEETAKNESKRSIRPPTCVAAQTPIESPKTATRKKLGSIIIRVLGNLSKTISETALLPEKLRRVRASPKSNVITRRVL